MRVGTRVYYTLFLLLGVCSAAIADITVSDYRATASTNAFAPLDRSQYFDEDIIDNISPSIANASGDWTGTNVGGSAQTWHWIGIAKTDVLLNLSPMSLFVSGSGQFSHTIGTTPDFVGPSSQVITYAPSSNSAYVMQFTTEEEGSFSIDATLSRWTYVTLYSHTSQNDVYSKVNTSISPFVVDTSGVLPIGTYTLEIATNFGGTTNQGASNRTDTGSFTNFLFTVQVPEPAFGGALAFVALFLRRGSRS